MGEQSDSVRAEKVRKARLKLYGLVAVLVVPVIVLFVVAITSGGGHSQPTGANPDDRPALLERVAQACRVEASTLYFQKYVSANERLAFPNGTLRPGWTLFYQGLEGYGTTFAIDDDGQTFC